MERMCHVDLQPYNRISYNNTITFIENMEHYSQCHQPWYVFNWLNWVIHSTFSMENVLLWAKFIQFPPWMVSGRVDVGLCNVSIWMRPMKMFNRKCVENRGVGLVAIQGIWKRLNLTKISSRASSSAEKALQLNPTGSSRPCVFQGQWLTSDDLAKQRIVLMG